MTTESAVKRIAKMEAYMDKVIEARKAGINVKEDYDLRYTVSVLSEYMESGAWLSDYTRHENGEFPANMKCGVLSQDTLYDLLRDIDKEKRSPRLNFRTLFTRKRIIALSILLILIIGLTGWVWWSNVTLEITTYTVVSQKLPCEFDGFIIAHVSDLHNEEIKGLIPALKNASPDIIVITGDIIDAKEMDLALEFAEEAADIAPCYYVTGNHEARQPSQVYGRLEEGLKEAGITVLHDEEAVIEKGGAVFSIVGLDDPSYSEALYTEGAIRDADSIKELFSNETFTLLLSHRPELFDRYVEAEADLVLCGHAHGGQVRIPFIGGIVAPNQGLFPKYDAGLFSLGNTVMIVSRGVGNGTVVPRINNRPELIFIELQSAES